MPESASRPGRVIAHVDMDAFYASVEVRDDETLRGLPLVVGGPAEKRGVVAAASYEARTFGIHSAMPMARAVSLCPDLVRISPRMSRYREVSTTIMGLLRTFSPLVEPLSLDEAFVDLTGTERTLGTPEEAGAQIRAAIRGETGLTASVGIGPNKFLAKLASEVDKPDGLTIIRPEDAVDFVQSLEVEKIWGVGEKTAAKLHRLGLDRTRDIAQAEPSYLRRHFGLMGLRLHELAWGRDERPVVPETDAKSVSHEITFAKNQKSLDMLLGVLTGLCQQVARRLRRHSTVGRTVNVKIRYGDFNTVTRQEVSGHPTDDAGEIYELASRLLSSEREIDDRPVRLLGVAVTGLLPRAQLNLDLFGDSEGRSRGASANAGDGGAKKRRALNDALDRLEDRFGPETVTRARSVSPRGDDEPS